MSVMKVNLMSEFEALALMPFKRLFAIKNKNDNYSQATSEYTAKLRRLYRINLERQLKSKRTQKCSTDSATFRLDLGGGGDNDDGSKPPIRRLDGITIERSSLPNADLGDRVILVKLNSNDDHDNDNDQSSEPLSTPPPPPQVIVGRGIVQAITANQIRIKLAEPLILEPESGTKSDEPCNSVIEEEEEVKEKDDNDNDNKEVESKVELIELELNEKKPDTSDERSDNAQTSSDTCNETEAANDGATTGHAGEQTDGASGDVGTSGHGRSSPGEQLKTEQSDTNAAADAASIECNKPRVIDFKIEFDSVSVVRPAQVSLRDAGQYSELIENVLNRFNKFKCDLLMHKNLLGFNDVEQQSGFVHDKARVIAFNCFGVKLKSQQRLAVDQSIRRRVSLIEGPAGSGKTLVAAHIAGNLSRLKRSKVLVCSPIQANVDKLAHLIDMISGVQVVKLPGDCPIKSNRTSVSSSNRTRSKQSSATGSTSSTRRNSSIGGGGGGGGGSLFNNMSTGECGASNYLDTLDVESSHCHLDKLVNDEIYLQAWNRSRETLRNHNDLLRSHAYRMVTSCSQHRRRELEARILSRADVICCTNQQAGSYLLQNIEFDFLILDDVQVTSEIDCLVPMMTKGIKQVTLLSDTRRRVRLARSLSKSVHSSDNNLQSNGNVSKNAAVAAAGDVVAVVADSVSVASHPIPIKQQNGTHEFKAAAANNNNNNSSNDNNNGHGNSTETSGRNQMNRQSSLTRRRRSYGKTARSSTGKFQVNNHRQNYNKIANDQYLGSSSSSSNSSSSSSEPSLEPGGLFERLLSIGMPTVDFRIQFRMHETLSNFTNHHFYLGRLKDDPDTNAKLKLEIETSLLMDDEKRFDWLPNRKYLTAMFKVAQPPSKLASKTFNSFKPMIDKLDELIRKLVFNENIQESRIGVIFNREISSSSSSSNNKDSRWLMDVSANVKRGTIKEFIGQERDFIILVALPGSAVSNSDSNDDNGNALNDQVVNLSICSHIKCDFKYDDSALNCALTRARLGMFIITNITDNDDAEQGAEINSSNGQGEPPISPINSSVCRGWSDFVSYYDESGLSVQ